MAADTSRPRARGAEVQPAADAPTAFRSIETRLSTRVRSGNFRDFPLAREGAAPEKSSPPLIELILALSL
jgi:hypothetical protein